MAKKFSIGRDKSNEKSLAEKADILDNKSDFYLRFIEIDKIVLHEFERVKNLMKKRAFPFDNKKMFEYINVYYQIKKEQDEIF